MQSEKKLSYQKLNDNLFFTHFKMNIDSLCTQNHQELYSQRTHPYRGQSVIQ